MFVDGLFLAAKLNNQGRIIPGITGPAAGICLLAGIVVGVYARLHAAADLLNLAWMGDFGSPESPNRRVYQSLRGRCIP
jgi:hypothetical protein